MRARRAGGDRNDIANRFQLLNDRPNTLAMGRTGCRMQHVEQTLSVTWSLLTRQQHVHTVDNVPRSSSTGGVNRTWAKLTTLKVE